MSKRLFVLLAVLSTIISVYSQRSVLIQKSQFEDYELEERSLSINEPFSYANSFFPFSMKSETVSVNPDFSIEVPIHTKTRTYYGVVSPFAVDEDLCLKVFIPLGKYISFKYEDLYHVNVILSEDYRGGEQIFKDWVGVWIYTDFEGNRLLQILYNYPRDWYYGDFEALKNSQEDT